MLQPNYIYIYIYYHALLLHRESFKVGKHKVQQAQKKTRRELKCLTSVLQPSRNTLHGENEGVF